MPENPELSCESTFTASFGVFILALGASEFILYLICRSLAWYANLVFYARRAWTGSIPIRRSTERSRRLTQKPLPRHCVYVNMDQLVSMINAVPYV
jgi:hypothetical protein